MQSSQLAGAPANGHMFMIVDRVGRRKSLRPRKRRASQPAIATRLGRRPWTVVVEPDPVAQIVYVVTAFPRG